MLKLSRESTNGNSQQTSKGLSLGTGNSNGKAFKVPLIDLANWKMDSANGSPSLRLESANEPKRLQNALRRQRQKKENPQFEESELRQSVAAAAPPLGRPHLWGPLLFPKGLSGAARRLREAEPGPASAGRPAPRPSDAKPI